MAQSKKKENDFWSSPLKIATVLGAIIAIALVITVAVITPAPIFAAIFGVLIGLGIVYAAKKLFDMADDNTQKQNDQQKTRRSELLKEKAKSKAVEQDGKGAEKKTEPAQEQDSHDHPNLHDDFHKLQDEHNVLKQQHAVLQKKYTARQAQPSKASQSAAGQESIEAQIKQLAAKQEEIIAKHNRVDGRVVNLESGQKQRNIEEVTNGHSVSEVHAKEAKPNSQVHTCDGHDCSHNHGARLVNS